MRLRWPAPLRSLFLAAPLAAALAAPPVRAADVTATLPTVTTAPGSTAMVAIVVTPSLENLDVRSIQVRMPLDPTYVSNAVWQPSGLVTTWGTPFTNTTATFTAIAAFGNDAITSISTSLATVELTVPPGAPLGADFPLTLDVFRLNGTTPTTAVLNGLLRIRTGGVDVTDAAAPGLALASPAPAPATTRTRLGFTLPSGAGAARLEIYGVDGRRVRRLADGVAAPGRHERWWDLTDASGARVAAGIYFVRLEWNRRSLVQRVAVTR